MRKRQNTLTARRAQRLKSAEQLIRQSATLTALEYNTLKYQAGILFLNQVYPSSDSEHGETYRKHFERIERCPHFWKWWKNEFDTWAESFVTVYRSKMKIKREFRAELIQLPGDPDAHNSFQHNYLKRIKNVRI